MTIDYLPWNRPATLADRVCMRDTNAELTYAEVTRRVDAVAGQFAAAGVGRGDVVAVMLPNRVELLLGLMAAWRLGAAATPINPVFTANEAGYQIADSGAKLLLTSDPGADYGVPVLPVDELSGGPFGSLPAPDTGLDDIALLIYTSGSTGRPKGVMLDHANLVAMALLDRRCDGAWPGRQLPAGPAAVPRERHRGELPGPDHGRRAGDDPAPVRRGYVPRGGVEGYRATYFSAVPAIYARLAELPAEQLGDTSSVRFAVCGAAPVSVELLHRSESRFGFSIIEGYGLTEGTCASAINPLYGLRKPGTVGVALPGQAGGHDAGRWLVRGGR